MNDAENIRAVWGISQLEGLWDKARQALEAPDKPATFRLELPDQQTRDKVGEVYGRPMWGQGTRINVSKLDRALRDTRFGLGLADVLEILHERPVVTRDSASAARTERRDRVTEVFTAALRDHGLADAPWAGAWVGWVQQFGRVAEQDLDAVAQRSAAVLARMTLTPDTEPRAWRSRADLAAELAGGAHELDNGTTLSRVVLRAAAIAHRTDSPANEAQRRKLWERCGVTLDAVSSTVLSWALPIHGDSALAWTTRARTESGLPTHLTQLDLRAAPERLVDAGTVIAVCENPRVLEAAATEGVAHPLVCTSGQLATIAVQLLDRLRADGAELRYHGDFDWAGVSIFRPLYEQDMALPWRMSAADYREAVNRASAQRVDLPVLTGEPGATPWDPELAELMSTAGRGVEEETVLDDLLADLRRGLE